MYLSNSKGRSVLKQLQYYGIKSTSTPVPVSFQVYTVPSWSTILCPVILATNLPAAPGTAILTSPAASATPSVTSVHSACVVLPSHKKVLLPVCFLIYPAPAAVPL